MREPAQHCCWPLIQKEERRRSGPQPLKRSRPRLDRGLAALAAEALERPIAWIPELNWQLLTQQQDGSLPGLSAQQLKELNPKPRATTSGPVLAAIARR